MLEEQCPAVTKYNIKKEKKSSSFIMSLFWNAEDGEKEIVSNKQAIHFITAMW